MTVFTFLPDWLVAVTLLLAICVFIVGQLRLAMALALPAVMRFLVWPPLIELARSTPLYVLAPAAILAAPVILIKGFRLLLVLVIGQRAADHALGRAVGEGMVDAVRLRQG